MPTVHHHVPTRVILTRAYTHFSYPLPCYPIIPYHHSRAYIHGHQTHLKLTITLVIMHPPSHLMLAIPIPFVSHTHLHISPTVSPCADILSYPIPPIRPCINTLLTHPFPHHPHLHYFIPTDHLFMLISYPQLPLQHIQCHISLITLHAAFCSYTKCTRVRSISHPVAASSHGTLTHPS